MNRQALVGLCVVALGVAAWFVVSRDGGGRARGAQGAAKERANEGTTPVANAPEVLVAAAPNPEDAAAASREELTGERQGRATLSDEELARGQWVEGVVVFPLGMPADERVSVVAIGKRVKSGALHSVEVGADGRFRVAFADGTLRGRLELRARYLYLPEPVRWELGQSGSITLEPLVGGRLEGRAILPVGVRPAEKDTIRIASELQETNSFRSWSSPMTLDKEGRFERGGLDPRAEHELIFDGAELTSRPTRFGVEPGETSHQDLVLELGVVLAGKVIDESGAPVPGAGVSADDPTSRGHRSGTTDELGSFRLRALQPGHQVTLFVTAPGFLDHERGLGALDEGLHDLVFVLARGGTIAGRLQWPDGSPAVGRVTVEGEAKGFRSGSTDPQESAADGSFEVSGLTGKTVTVRAHATRSGVPSATGELTGHEQESGEEDAWFAEAEDVKLGTKGLVLTLAPSLELVGTVIVEGGGPVKTFQLQALPLVRNTSEVDWARQAEGAFEDESGSFRLTGLMPGKWRVGASAQDFLDAVSVEVELPDEHPVTLVLRRPAAIRGVVVDASGAPVQGASVAVEPQEVLDQGQSFSFSAEEDVGLFQFLSMAEVLTTDAEGRFFLAKAEPGRLRVSATAPGHAPSEPVLVDAVAGRETSGVVVRLAVGGTIRGEVVDVGGRPAARTTVWACNQDSDDYFESVTADAEGRFELRGAPAGSYDLSAELPSGLEITAEAELAAGGSAFVRLEPETRSVVRLSGRVTLAGKPAPGLHVNAFSHGRDGSSSAETDSAGEFELALPGGGHYGIALTRWHWNAGTSATWQASVDVPEASEYRVELALPLAKISGRVTSNAGEPLEGIEVTATGHEREFTFSLMHASVSTDSEGRYELEVAPGSLQVSAGGAGAWATATREGIELALDQELSGVDFVLAPGGVVTGRIHFADGSSAVAASILRSGDEWLAESDDEGRFMLTNLPAGPFEFEVVHDSGVSAQPITVMVVAGEVSTVEVELVRGTRVSIALVGVPAGVEPEITLTDALGRTRQVLRDVWLGERVELGALADGSYTLRVTAGERHAETTFSLSGGGGELAYTLTLE